MMNMSYIHSLQQIPEIRVPKSSFKFSSNVIFRTFSSSDRLKFISKRFMCFVKIVSKVPHKNNQRSQGEFRFLKVWKSLF